MTNMNADSKIPPARVSKSPLTYLRMRDARGHSDDCDCDRCREARDRLYSHRHRYGARTTVSTRRVDRIDENRELY